MPLNKDTNQQYQGYRKLPMCSCIYPTPLHREGYDKWLTFKWS